MMNRSALLGQVLILQVSMSLKVDRCSVRPSDCPLSLKIAYIRRDRELVFLNYCGTATYPVGSKLSTGEEPLLLLSLDSRELSTEAADCIGSTPSCRRSARVA